MVGCDTLILLIFYSHEQVDEICKYPYKIRYNNREWKGGIREETNEEHRDRVQA